MLDQADSTRTRPTGQSQAARLCFQILQRKNALPCSNHYTYTQDDSKVLQLRMYYKQIRRPLYGVCHPAPGAQAQLWQDLSIG